jgi:hypothetical protein
MTMWKMIIALLGGVILGVAAHMAWQAACLSDAMASGVLRHEPQMHPAVSAIYPSGFYVESRVYLETASTNMIGQKVAAWGRLELARDPDAPAFPKIRNKEMK